ncbi:MAG: MotA/TolQ/ExbB proton channel family protein [Akkermansiaceae bacterium]|nr:MotA/TolQ/ExbB proton channel family protein [Akkermansiaceae bacterium]NNM29437.1 MotA/TolQ/ExbB proton channel family protein [Akkermansiaceae bacterium]
MQALLDYGGPVLWLQVALAFFAVVFVVERLLYFHGVRMNAADFLLGLANHIRRKAYAEAIHEASRTPGPVARVAHSVLIRHHMPRSDLREIAEEAVRLEIPRIEKNMRALLGIALLAPLAGLLGTVLGLIDVFMEINEAGGQASHASMAGGIFESLVTTAAGLCIATGSYVFYLSMLGKGKRLLFRLERTGIEVVNLIIDSGAQSDIVSFREELEARQRGVSDPEAAAADS